MASTHVRSVSRPTTLCPLCLAPQVGDKLYLITHFESPRPGSAVSFLG
jgi:hypothetical protein